MLFRLTLLEGKPMNSRPSVSKIKQHHEELIAKQTQAVEQEKLTKSQLRSAAKSKPTQLAESPVSNDQLIEASSSPVSDESKISQFLKYYLQLLTKFDMNLVKKHLPLVFDTPTIFRLFDLADDKSVTKDQIDILAQKIDQQFSRGEVPVNTISQFILDHHHDLLEVSSIKQLLANIQMMITPIKLCLEQDDSWSASIKPEDKDEVINLFLKAYMQRVIVAAHDNLMSDPVYRNRLNPNATSSAMKLFICLYEEMTNIYFETSKPIYSAYELVSHSPIYSFLNELNHLHQLIDKLNDHIDHKSMQEEKLLEYKNDIKSVVELVENKISQLLGDHFHENELQEREYRGYYPSIRSYFLLEEERIDKLNSENIVFFDMKNAPKGYTFVEISYFNQRLIAQAVDKAMNKSLYRQENAHRYELDLQQYELGAFNYRLPTSIWGCNDSISKQFTNALTMESDQIKAYCHAVENYLKRGAHVPKLSLSSLMLNGNGKPPSPNRFFDMPNSTTSPRNGNGTSPRNSNGTSPRSSISSPRKEPDISPRLINSIFKKSKSSPADLLETQKSSPNLHQPH